jgi:hypothetical protein
VIGALTQRISRYGEVMQPRWNYLNWQICPFTFSLSKLPVKHDWGCQVAAVTVTRIGHYLTR